MSPSAKVRGHREGMAVVFDVVSLSVNLSFVVAAFLGACATQPPPITKLVGGQPDHNPLGRPDGLRAREPGLDLRRARALAGRGGGNSARHGVRRGLARVARALGGAVSAAGPRQGRRIRGTRVAQARAKRQRLACRCPRAPGAGGRGGRGGRASPGDQRSGVRGRATTMPSPSISSWPRRSCTTLDLPSAQNTLEVLTQAEPASAAGHMRLTAVYWALGAMAKAEADAARGPGRGAEPDRGAGGAGLDLRGLGQERRSPEGLPRGHRPFRRRAGNRGGLCPVSGRHRQRKRRSRWRTTWPFPKAAWTPTSLRGRVELERSARRYDRALALLAQAREVGIAENQKTRLSLTQAAILKDQGKSDEALAALKKVAKDSPLYFESRLRAAELLRDAGKVDEATRMVEEARAGARRQRRQRRQGRDRDRGRSQPRAHAKKSAATPRPPSPAWSRSFTVTPTRADWCCSWQRSKSGAGTGAMPWTWPRATSERIAVRSRR